MSNKTAIIIGAGPAGLTAAYELLEKTDIKPVIYEMTGEIGGISRTEIFKGNRIDIGGHRFFSKSNDIMEWWYKILPMQGAPSRDDIKLNRMIPLSQEPDAPDPEKTDRVMLYRNRLSRIFFEKKFYDYPVSLNINTVINLGLFRVVLIGLSYTKAKLFPIKEEISLEDFVINRFGRKLYKIFFKDYTEKLWGLPCNEISAEWGTQRIKGLSVTRVVFRAVRNMFFKDKSIEQKNVETSLIEQFVYPKLGPGQMWEKVAELVKRKGGKIFMNHRVTGIKCNDDNVSKIIVEDCSGGETFDASGDYYFSTMPVNELIAGMGNDVPEDVRDVGLNLSHRNLIIVGLLLKKLLLRNQTDIKTINNIIPDSWIYIQDNDVNVGRLQVFNNWNPYMVKDEDTVWIGLEIACNDDDHICGKTDENLSELTVNELVYLGIIDREDLLDSVVIRQSKAYPIYFGSYSRFDILKKYTDSIENLFLLGRNGMHRYNNMDHSMHTAMTAVDNIINGISSRENIWNINIEDDYHEVK